MADERQEAGSSGPRLLSEEEKTARRKRYYAERDSSKIYLFDQHARWWELKEEVNAKADKDLATILLDHFISSKTRNFR